MHPMFDPERRCTPVEEWPENDRKAWARACQPFDPLDTTVGFVNRWAASTRRLVELSYGRWLGWQERAALLTEGESPGARATRERVAAYLEMLSEFQYAPFTVAGRLQQLGDALRAMEPDDDWSWILRAAARIKEQAHPITDLHDRLQSPEEIVQLGIDLMGNAEAADEACARAILFRDGLALAGLIYRPLRIGNFSSIEIGRHLVREGQRWRLDFKASEMKAGRPFECIWPEELTGPLEQYLEVHRPVLLGDAGAEAANKSLWVSKTGAGMTRSVLGYRIKKRTRDRFGAGINPHAFRHIVATTVAMEDPENITAVPAILGHASLETTERHYNRARMVHAGNRYQDTIGFLRSSLRSTT